MQKLYKTSVTFLAAALLYSGSVFAQYSKNVAINNVDKVSVQSGIDLYITQGNSEGAKLVGDKELLDKVVMEKNGTQLSIKYKESTGWSNLFRNRKTPKVYLTVRNLSEIKASGGSDVYAQNTIKTNRLSITTSGGADVDMNVVCKDIIMKASGGSDIDIKGSATNMDLEISGGSDADAEHFSVDYAKVSASGGSDASLLVNKALEAEAHGGSDVAFRGNASLKTSSSKSGSVKRIN